MTKEEFRTLHICNTCIKAIHTIYDNTTYYYCGFGYNHEFTCSFIQPLSDIYGGNCYAKLKVVKKCSRYEGKNANTSLS